MKLIDADKMLKRIESWNTSDAMDKALYSFTLNRIVEQPTVDAIPVLWIKEWVEEIKDHPAYTEKEKTLCIEELEDMLGAWAERKE